MFRIEPTRLVVLMFLVFFGSPFSASAQTLSGKFDVGGRKIALACQGNGDPTVVVDAGLGTAPVEDPAWMGIAAKVAAVSRICRFDRAGLGGSDPSPKPVVTSADAVDDEINALAAAGAKGPFLVVGHSIGGLNAQVFAARHPSKVAGLVLVSTTHPDQLDVWSRLLPAAAESEPKAVTDARAFMKTMQSEPSQNPERLDLRQSEEQARQLRSLGSKPVIVLTHSPKFRMVPGLDETLSVKLENATQRMQKQYLLLSTNSTQHIAATAGHHLPDEAPDFVSDGIVEAVRAVRSAMPASSSLQ